MPSIPYPALAERDPVQQSSNAPGDRTQIVKRVEAEVAKPSEVPQE
jgi:hypothetical protein